MDFVHLECQIKLRTVRCSSPCYSLNAANSTKFQSMNMFPRHILSALFARKFIIGKANSFPRTWRRNLWMRRAQKRDYQTFFSITCCAKLGGKRAKKQLLLLVDLGCRFAAPNINVSHVKTMKHGQTTENEDCQAKKGEREILIVKQELLKSKRNSIKHCRSQTENFSPSIRAQTGRSRKSLRTTFRFLRSARRPRHIRFDILLIKRPPYDSVLIENDFSFGS